MNEGYNNTETIISAFNSLNPNCVGDYASIILGVLLFISEALPFYAKNCKDDVNVVDIDGNISPIEKQPSVLHNSNGVLHTAISFYKLLNKK